MTKRIFAIIVAVISAVLLFSSCFDGEPEITGAPETTEEIPEEVSATVTEYKTYTPTPEWEKRG